MSPDKVLVKFPGPQGPGGRGYNSRGDWQPDTAYAVDDIVNYLGSAYRVTSVHTSPAEFDGVHLAVFVARGEQGEQGPTTGVAVFGSLESSTPTPSAPAAALLPGNLIMGMGDSIIAHGDNGQNSGVQTGVSNPSVNALSWLAWAALYGSGRLKYGGVSATSGITTAQILSIHLPLVISAAPTACLVLGGRNDVFQTIPFATTKANLSSIYAQLAAANIVPILCTLTPITGAPDSQQLLTQKLNTWIRNRAAANRWPLVDLFAAGMNPLTGQWVSGYNTDLSHPNITGCRALGIAVAAALSPWLPPHTLNIAAAQFGSGQSPNEITNALNLTDANTDGVPDGWTASGGSGFTSTLDDASADGVAGKWWTINRTSGTGAVTYLGPSFSTASNAKVAIGFALRSASIEAGGAQISVCLVNAANTAQVVAGLSGWSGDVVSAGQFYCEGLAPSGSVRPLVSISGGTGVLKLGRLTALNLTANGIA